MRPDILFKKILCLFHVKKAFKKRYTVCLKRVSLNEKAFQSILGRITTTGLTMTEEALRMVVLEWFQTIWTPEIQRGRNKSEIYLISKSATLSMKTYEDRTWSAVTHKDTKCVPDSAQAHLFTGKLKRSLHTVILSFSLQIHIQADTQSWNLIGQELVSWTRALQFIFEHIHLTLHGLKEVQD